MVEIESTPYIKTCTKWRFLEIAIHKWKICKRGQYCRKTTQTHSTHFVIVKFDSKPTNPGLNCLRMFARLEVDDQLPSPPVTKETPRSLSKLNVRRIFVILAQFSPRWRHRWYWRPWLQLRQRWSRPLPRWLRPDGKYDWLSFHRSEIATSFGLSWWTEVAGGAELLVSQGKATNGWKASCLLLAPVSSPSHCSWKVLLAGLLIKEAQARVREVQVSMEQGWWSHLCNQLYHNSLQKEYGEECSQWWSRVEWPGSWVCGLWRGVGWGVGCCRREDGTPAAAARLLRSSTHPFYWCAKACKYCIVLKLSRKQSGTPLHLRIFTFVPERPEPHPPSAKYVQSHFFVLCV